MPSTDRSRAAGARLGERAAAIRTAHAQASALAQLEDRAGPPETAIAASLLADHVAGGVSRGEGDPRLLFALDGLLRAVESELGMPRRPPGR